MNLFAWLMIFIFWAGNIKKNSQINDGIHDNKCGKIYGFFAFFTLWFLLAFKGEYIGKDTSTYIGIFNDAARWIKYGHADFFKELFINEGRYETGYIVLNRIVALLTNNAQWIFIITATFFVLTWKKFMFKYSYCVPLSLFFFISLRYYYFYLSGIRQSIAMVICLFAFEFVKKRKLVLFSLVVLLAMQFHNTAIIFLAIYPLSHLKFNVKGIVLVSLAMIVALIGFNFVLENVFNIFPEYELYTTSVKFEAGKLGNAIHAVILLLFLCVSFFSNYNNKENKGLYIKEFNNSFVFSYIMLFGFWLTVVSLKATTLDRLAHYTDMFCVIYITNVLLEMRNPKERNIVIWQTIILTFAYNIITLMYRPEWFGITPYTFFWQ